MAIGLHTLQIPRARVTVASNVTVQSENGAVLHTTEQQEQLHQYVINYLPLRDLKSSFILFEGPGSITQSLTLRRHFIHDQLFLYRYDG